MYRELGCEESAGALESLCASRQHYGSSSRKSVTGKTSMRGDFRCYLVADPEEHGNPSAVPQLD